MRIFFTKPGTGSFVGSDRVRNASKIRIVFCLLLIAVLIAHTIYYAWAVSFLRRVDLRSRGDLSGAIFFSRPKSLFVGQTMNRDDLVKFLKQIEFRENSDSGYESAFSLLGGNGLRVQSRFPEFPSVNVWFQNGRIARIQTAEGTDVLHAEIQPEMVATFVETIRGENTKRFLARRRVVHAQEVMNTDLLYAVMASEDSTFMTHHGIRYLHLLLSVFQHRGGSTISMQVIKNIITADSSYSLLRKLNELYLTVAIEQRLSKEQIIELYMNHVYLGSADGRFALYGFLAAAETLFNKRNISDLTLSEACTLAGMTNGPATYLEEFKRGDYAAITERRNRVLNLLNKNWPDRYTDHVIEEARQQPITFNLASPFAETRRLDEVSRAFIAKAVEQPELVPLNDLPASEYSVLRVFTSIDADLMRSGEGALRNHLAGLKQASPPVDNHSGLPVEDQLLGAIVALDPKTGQIITMVGEGDSGLKSAAVAINAIAPPASTIKPFIVAKALSTAVLPDGMHYSAATRIDPNAGSLGNWRPKMGVGQTARVRRCLSLSDDGCATFTAALLGLTSVADLYHDLTGNRPSSSSPLLAIGFGAQTEISPLTQARAYSVFSNEGVRARPTAIYKISHNGKDLAILRPPSEAAVLEPGAAYVTAQMLRSVLGWGYDGDVGTARNVAFARNFVQRHPDVEIGAKTGSGPNSVWLVSISPN